MVVLGLAVLIPVLYWNRHRRHMAESIEKFKNAVETGMTEPPSLHPKIDINACICTGACLSVCPEGGIIGIIDGCAQLISPSKCIGHGACQVACPVDAISLVFGTEKRGMDIPNVRETFESNIDGVYIAGELGGMGLIRNAITQGREAVESIAKSLNGDKSDAHDLIIVGAGPAGFAATLEAKKRGLDAVTLEQEEGFGGTIRTYPRQKLVMTQPMDIPLHGKYDQREIQKEELIGLFDDIVEKNNLTVNSNEQVDSITRNSDHFVVKSSKREYKARKVLLTIGRRGTPRKLGVAGEQSTKIAYKLLEPEQFKNMKLLVVGGGDSAVEAALSLGEQEGTTVTISYRKDVFSRIKEGNRTRITSAIEAGWVSFLKESQVTEVLPDQVRLTQRDQPLSIPNDFVFVFIGGELPTKLLTSIGIIMETKFGER